ncbi:cardiolipin synthase (CMP-forming)-like isoform X2 [Acanthaster planci]|uniref:cardiolipin synthase (CMP-forming) n=1 Tax=Acanthaster planci TaxID=133434 RepID=A0A8B7YXP4_ACAPL|nr:cardiolipin synthase (CMP-forming)-like isoform X2 [Acanthaster planci]
MSSCWTTFFTFVAMNGQSARILEAASGLLSNAARVPNSVKTLTFKTFKCSTCLCDQGPCIYPHIKNPIWWTQAKSVTALAVSTHTWLSTVHGLRHPKLYSTSSPQKADDEQGAKDDMLSSGESPVKANLAENEAACGKKRKGKMNRYVKRASKATEKMKEKMADKVKDIKENIFTIPNLLSTTRLVMSPVLGYLVIQECYTLGTCLFVMAGITDLLDGFIARNFRNQQSVLGSIIDPLADKCLVAILTLSLTFSGLIPVPLTILMVSRDVGLVGSVFYLRYQSLPPPRTVSRFFDITHATVQLKPTTISKLNTAVQLGLVGFTLAAPVFHYVDHPLLHALWYATAATTILSGFSYVFSKDAFKFLRK